MSRLTPRRRDVLLATGLWIALGRRALAAPSPPRRLSLKNANTGESFDGPYRDAEGPLPAAIADLANFLRDHHANVIGPVESAVGTADFERVAKDVKRAICAKVLKSYHNGQAAGPKVYKQPQKGGR